ncbi:similar to Saccharomyces cerevisiae YHR176W FMO1 Flavin-containing monooxygenase, localized to the cytoplasmic face of the ER membrane [Maudiozyma saulgeensis]|uniref:Similar to Saccharomyces cerevisiae YHR176W FMO1 Flavin-containing monooxygenase, localized to the cytoplasmic face of the ER membrane n=1 Tax=Maudiozyma saulgeensis TaxID=1789683 RepID=A0A1X7R4X0_9SACH|nr:similar to Saccharomyces cerevisiae YHR176W FMO1 Flavin-containing monooxygenase, localized to the cytoplasmic face of the ER membrane [Kazachstania saulgeensis]
MTKKRLAIIGGGPGGLAAARVFLANAPGEFDIDLFTNDVNVGGIWYFPHGDSRPSRVMYDHLETNIPKHVMQYKGVPFPPHWFKYPRRHEVWVYLKRYYNEFIRDVEDVKVHLSSEIVNVNKQNSQWSLEVIDHSNEDTHRVEEFDYVIAATGHFSTPRIPSNVPGLDEWFTQKDAFHSRNFYDCEFIKGKRVVVIGDGSSGQDIVNQCASVAEKVFQSVASGKDDKRYYDNDPTIEVVNKIKSVNWKERTVTLEDGIVLSKIDKLVYATGFLYDLSIFDSKLRQDLLITDSSIGNTTTTSHVNNLWEQIFYTKDSTLAFSLLPQLVVPFPLAELQASLIVKAFTGKLQVPNQSDSTFDHLPSGHNIPAEKEIEYYHELLSILADVSDPTNPDKFQPEAWDEDKVKERSITAQEKYERNIQLNKYSQEARSKGNQYELIQFINGPPPKGVEAPYP